MKQAVTNKWELVVAAILREIEEGAYAAGDRFYTVKELCGTYEISNTTARRVFNELKECGFISSHGRAGTRVIRTSLRLKKVYMGLSPAMFSNGTEIVNSGHFMHEFMSGFATSEAGKLFDLIPLASDFLIDNIDRFVGRPVLLSGNIVLQEDEAGHLKIDHALARRLHEALHPVFFHTFPGLEGVTQLKTDLFASLYLPVQHLIEMGHTRIGLVIDDTSTVWSRERLHGYLDALHEAGIGMSPGHILIVETPEDAAACAALDALLDPSSGITAVACATDRHALAVLERCRQRGIRVPDDLAVTGSDDIPEASLSSPPLTSVNGRDRDKGAFAAALLARRLGGESLAPETHAFEPHLVVRQSSRSSADSMTVKKKILHTKNAC